jgi:hypothetical protein
MISQLEFPYLAGATFVSQLWGSGDWQAVDDAYADPPASTEQVLHPEKYRDREAPQRIADPGLAARMGDGWRSVESSTVGEAMLAIWLEELGAAAADADAAAAGWGGDRLSVARGPNGQWAMAWHIAWDAAAEVEDFDAAYAQVSAGGGLANDMQAISATERLVLHASSAATLDALAGALGG